MITFLNYIGYRVIDNPGWGSGVWEPQKASLVTGILPVSAPGTGRSGWRVAYCISKAVTRAEGLKTWIFTHYKR